MGNEMQTLNERIAERIGKDLVDLIPDDQWQKMVDKEIATFKNVTAPKIINALMREAFTNAAKLRVDELCLSDDWNSMTNEQINTRLKEFLGDSAGVIFGAMLAPTMGMVLQDLRNRLGYNQ
jgi:hypothetical protein